MAQNPRQTVLLGCLANLAYFASMGLYRFFRGIKLSNIKLLNLSLVVICVSIVFLCLCESYRPKEDIKVNVSLLYFIPA